MNIFNRDKYQNEKERQERIRISFQRMKEDILYLQHEIIILKDEMRELNQSLSQILKQFKQFLPSNTSPTHAQHMAKTPTHVLPNQAPNKPYFHSSIGNRGVPTDSQQIVNRQSNTLNRTSAPIQHIQPIQDPSKLLKVLPYTIEDFQEKKTNFDAQGLSTMVANMRKDLQEKFKKLTKQEFLVFSILYTLEEEQGQVTYRDIAARANLAESSARDYISRLEHKGIPLVKERINNKIVLLKIPQELRNIATLDSLSKLVRF